MVAYHVSLVATQHNSDQSTGFGGTKSTFVANSERISYCCAGGGLQGRRICYKSSFGCFVHPNALVSRKDYASLDVQSIQKIFLQHIFEYVRSDNNETCRRVLPSALMVRITLIINSNTSSGSDTRTILYR